MKRVIFDTNFLVDLARFKVDIDGIEDILAEPYEFFTIKNVVGELQKLATRKSRHAMYAKVALKLLDQKQIQVLKVEEKKADNALVKLADKNTVIATNDIALRKKLKILGVKTIYLKGKNQIAIN